MMGMQAQHRQRVTPGYPPAAVVAASLVVMMLVCSGTAPSAQGYPHMSPTEAADQLMATTYRSCDVLSGVADTIGQTDYTSRYLAKVAGGVNAKGCPYPAADSIAYVLGGLYRYKGGELDVNVPTDCSTFMSAVLGAAGLKAEPSQRSRYKRYTTYGLATLYRKNNPCFEFPLVLTPDDNLRPGDIINARAGRDGDGNPMPGHVMMVDNVGQDPFGIQKAKTVEACKSITTADFDFSYIHDYPPNIHKARYILNYFDEQLETIARDLCARRFSKDPALKLTRPIASSRTVKAGTWGLVILRHRGTEAGARCTMRKPVTLKGGSCVDRCTSK